MTFRYRYTGSETIAYVTTQKNVAPGEILESDIPLSRPELELIEDVPVVEEVKDRKTSAVVPETNESPVSGDEIEEN